MRGAECLGADVLMQLLKNYARSRDVKKAITVGLIGYPNVGKVSFSFEKRCLFFVFIKKKFFSFFF